MVVKTSYNLLKTSNNEDLRVKCIWSDLSCKFLFIFKQKAFEGERTEVEIKNFASANKILAPDYFQKVKTYICVDQKGVEIEFTDRFIMSMPISQGKKKIYFSVILTEVDFSTAAIEFIDNLMSDKKTLDSVTKDLEEELTIVKKDREECRAILEKSLEDDKNHEKELLSGFVLLLNEKKKRIQFLTDVIEANKYNLEIKIKEPQKVQEVLSDSESEESNYSTDKEDQSKSQITQGDSSDELMENDSPPPSLSISRESREEHFEGPSPKKQRPSGSSDMSTCKPSTSKASDNLPKTVTVDEKEKSQAYSLNTLDIFDNI